MKCIRLELNAQNVTNPIIGFGVNVVELRFLQVPCSMLNVLTVVRNSNIGNAIVVAIKGNQVSLLFGITNEKQLCQTASMWFDSLT